MKDDAHSHGMIPELSEILTALLTMKKSGKYQQAINLIDDTLVRHFDFDAQKVNDLSEDLLKGNYPDNQKLSPDLSDALAQLLTEKGDLLCAQNRCEESRQMLSNALGIYFLLNEQQDFFSFERMNRMVWLNKKLASINSSINA